jgi:hypothetical protein
MNKIVWSILAIMVLFIASYAGKITLVQDKDGYTGCVTETYYNYDHWDKRHWFQDWLNQGPSFATEKSFARNGGTKIADMADYCC